MFGNPLKQPPPQSARTRYSIKSLWGPAQKKARENPDAWRAFKKKMRGRQYGMEPLSDAWVWFLSGWDSAHVAALKRAMENDPRNKL
jgi:hypothetical protein